MILPTGRISEIFVRKLLHLNCFRHVIVTLMCFSRLTPRDLLKVKEKNKYINFDTPRTKLGGVAWVRCRQSA